MLSDTLPDHLYFAFLYFGPFCFHGYNSITGAKINKMKKMMSLSFTIIGWCNNDNKI